MIADIKKRAEALVILQAVYRTDERRIDVTEEVAKKVLDGKLHVRVTNNIAGDPHPGVGKRLFVKYMTWGSTQTVEKLEGELVSFPPPER